MKNKLGSTKAQNSSPKIKLQKGINIQQKSSLLARAHVNIGAAIRGPCRRDTRSLPPRYEVPCGAATRGPWGQNKNPKIWGLGHL